MRRGNEPQIVYDPKGRILGIGTGSDACSEHEGGSEDLMRSLVGTNFTTKKEVAAKLRSGALKKTPDLMESRRIKVNLDKLIYGTRTESNEVYGAVGFCAGWRSEMTLHELIAHQELRVGSSPEGQELAGAWDQGSFGFKVKGQKLADKLEEFSLALVGGGGIFAGLFLEGKDGRSVAGVCIARENLLRPEHRAAMKKAQEEFERGIELEVASRADELMRLACANPAARAKISHISARWGGESTKERVMYWVNAAYRVQLKKGLYTFEELREWIEGNAAAAI